MLGSHHKDSYLFPLKQNPSINIIIFKIFYTIHMVKIENQVPEGDIQIGRISFSPYLVWSSRSRLGAGWSVSGLVEKFSPGGYGWGCRGFRPLGEREGRSLCTWEEDCGEKEARTKTSELTGRPDRTVPHSIFQVPRGQGLEAWYS